MEISAREYIKTPRGGRDLIADFEALQSYFLGQARHFAPAVVRVASLFEEDFVFEYPEVISLMYTRLVLEATPPKQEAVLDLREISLAEGHETVDDVKGVHSRLGSILADKIALYNRVFKILSDNEADVRERFARTRGRALIAEVEGATSGDAKGRLLEELMAVLFEAGPGFEIVERRFSTGGEEIDLLLKNNVGRPFWSGLNSPLVFVECKNWSGPVGSGEARDFEIKLQNHRPLVRVGLFVAYGGVTNEFMNELRRASRADYSISVLQREDIVAFLNGSQGVVDWVEEHISRPI
jgi:Holliday junction resolvase-like predicted endonuclease